jgi:hypothetical protein
MDGKRLVRKVRDSIPNGRSSLGTSKMRWNDTKNGGCNARESVKQKGRGNMDT